MTLGVSRTESVKNLLTCVLIHCAKLYQTHVLHLRITLSKLVYTSQSFPLQYPWFGYTIYSNTVPWYLRIPTPFFLISVSQYQVFETGMYIGNAFLGNYFKTFPVIRSYAFFYFVLALISLATSFRVNLLRRQ